MVWIIKLKDFINIIWDYAVFCLNIPIHLKTLGSRRILELFISLCSVQNFIVFYLLYLSLFVFDSTRFHFVGVR